MSATPITWTPTRRVFARRAWIMAALTFAAALAFVGFTEISGIQFLAIGLGLPIVLTVIFLLEDFARWRGIREESWTLEPPHLIHDGANGRAMIPLSDIDSARTRLGNVVITLTSGRRILMRYLDNPQAVADALNILSPPMDLPDEAPE